MAISQVWDTQVSASGATLRAQLTYDPDQQALLLVTDNGTPGVPADGTGMLTVRDDTLGQATELVTLAWNTVNDATAHVIATPISATIAASVLVDVTWATGSSSYTSSQR